MLLGGEVPGCDLDSLMEGQGERPLVATARPADPMGQRQRVLVLQAWPDFGLEDANDLVEGRNRIEEDLHETQARAAGLVDEFQRGNVGFVGANLTVPNHPIAGKLKPCNLVT